MRTFPMGIGILLAAGCGGLHQFEEEDDYVPAPHSDLGDLESQWLGSDDSEPVTPISALGEVYRFEFADGISRATPKVMELLAETLASDIALEVLSDHTPMNDVRLAGLSLEASPVAQDPCVPTQEPFEATFDEATGKFVVNFKARDLNLGQPFNLMTLTVEGYWDDMTMQVSSPRLIIEADAFTLGDALYGADRETACEYFDKDDVTCQMCDEGPCVIFVIDGFHARNVADLSIEPLSTADVDASCF